MKKILLVCVAIVLVFASIASSADISDDPIAKQAFQHRYVEDVRSEDPIAKVPWNTANIDKLRALDKAAIERFTDIKEGGNELLDFGWFDLAGDGRYELAIVYSGGRGPNWLDIYWQDAPGKMRKEGPDSFPGAAAKLSETFRDLNGDGKLELVLYSSLGVGAEEAEWPQIHRLQNGSWVDASRDFPKFYDTEVLPQLEKDISEAREEVAKHQGDPKPAPGPRFVQRKVEWRQPQRHLAALVMVRDTILRVLGRDPTAGLAEAREWMKSDDPYLVLDAVAVLEDIGGHEQELSAAKSTLERVQQHAPPADSL